MSGGARYTSGSVEYHFNHPGLLVIDEPFTADEHRWDWLVSTDYQITDNMLGYATISTGSRPPGITTIVITAQQMRSTPEEDLRSYEVGFKDEFLDHRVRLNLAAFYSDYRSRSTTEAGVQCLGELPGATWQASAATCAGLFPANPATVPWYITVGKPATIKGFEWDLVAAPWKGLQFDFSGGYNKFESGVHTPGQPGYIHPGNHLQPEWNMHANAQYAFQSAVGTITPRVDVSWQSQQDFDPAPGAEAPQPLYTIKPYAIANAQVDYIPNAGQVDGDRGCDEPDRQVLLLPAVRWWCDQCRRATSPRLREYFFSVRRDFEEGRPNAAAPCLVLDVSGGVAWPARNRSRSASTRADPALDALIAPDAKLKTVASGFGFVDTPLWIRGEKGAEGYLVAVSIIDNVVYKIASNGKVSVWLDKAGYSGDDFLHDGKLATIGRMHVILMGPGCVAVDGQGRTVWCAGQDRAIKRLEKDGTRTVLADKFEGKRFNGPNDVALTRGRRHLFHGLGRGPARWHQRRARRRCRTPCSGSRTARSRWW